MITGQLRSKIDKLWEEFWTGGITNPLTVIEQISYLMFARLFDMRENTEEKNWSRKHKTTKKRFPGMYFPADKQNIRWSNLKQEADGDEVLRLVRDELFPHFRVLGKLEEAATDRPANTFGQYMKDATLMVNKPSLLVKAITMVDELPLTQGDTKGDLYEYLLSKLTTAGINGQFRTPRHVIRAMVDVVLHDKRNKIGADDDWQDLDVLRKAWPKWNGGKGKKHFKDRTAKAFFVPKKEIEDNVFDLSINRYKEIVHEEVEYDPPKVIIGRLKKLEKEIAKDLKELEAMLG